MVYSSAAERSRPKGQEIRPIKYVFFIITNLKYSMLHFNPHLKSINMSALRQNAIFRSKCNIFSHHPPLPGVAVFEKWKGNVNLHSTVPFFIRSIILSKYSRTLLTTFLWFSRFRIFGNIAFWKEVNIIKNFEEIFEKTKSKFWRNFLHYKMY